MTLYLLEAAPPPSLRAEIARLIDQNGPGRTLAALLGVLAVRARRPRSPGADDIGTHLRRDIGLPPVTPRADYWRHL